MSETTQRCRLCGEEVRWAMGLRWMGSQGRLSDVRHLIRADNGLHSGRCPASTDVDRMHESEPEPTAASGESA